MKGAAVVDRHRARRSFEIDHLAHIDRGDVFWAEATDPFVLVIILVHHGAVVAAGQNSQRSLVGGAIIDVGAGGTGAVIGVRPERNVLMPFHLIAAL